MTRRLAQQIVIGAFALALLLAPLATVAPTLASRTPSSFHWARKQSQFTLQVGDNADGGWNSMLNRVVSDWNENDAVTFRVINGRTNPQECQPRTGTVQVCNWRYGTQQGWLGLTRLYFNDRGDHVEAGTVQMNDSYFDSNSQYNDDDARRHTLCHELGHTPGLDHVSTNSCMNDSQQAVFNNTQPTNRDFRDLERIYKHKDSTSTVAGKEKKKQRDKAKNNRKDRDRDRRDRAGFESIFDSTALPSAPGGLNETETVTVERLDDGRKVVSFITWAQE